MLTVEALLLLIMMPRAIHDADSGSASSADNDAAAADGHEDGDSLRSKMQTTGRMPVMTMKLPIHAIRDDVPIR